MISAEEIKALDWQEIANELSDGIREINAALDSYNKALNTADEARKQIRHDKGTKQVYDDSWNGAEGGVMAIEDAIRELAQLTDFIEEKLV